MSQPLRNFQENLELLNIPQYLAVYPQMDDLNWYFCAGDVNNVGEGLLL